MEHRDCALTPLPSGLLPADRAAWLAARVTPLAGWCSPAKAIRLADLILHVAPMISVDLGVFGARSTLALAEGHRALGYGYVTGIDPWTRAAALEGTNELINEEWWGSVDMEATYRAAMATMVRHAVLPHWQLLRVRSGDGAAYFSDQSIGLLHQDSNHSPEVSQEELRLWIPKMVPGGIWVMDDTNWPSLQDTKRLLQSQYGAVLIEEHDIHSASGLACWQVYQLP